MWLLEALTDGALDGLDECLSSGVLRAQADGVVFRHELARLAVEGSVPPDRAVALHRRALIALADPALGAPDLARLAHHAEAAGDGPAVLRYAPAAGEQAAALGSPREAQQHYWRRCVSPVGSTRRRGLSCSSGSPTTPTGPKCAARRSARSTRRLPSIGALATPCEKATPSGGKRDCSLASDGRGKVLSTAREAVRVLEQAPPGLELARAYSAVAGLSMLTYDLAPTLAWGAKAIALADEVGDREALVHALNNVGTAELVSGNPAGQAKLERSLELPARRISGSTPGGHISTSAWG